MRRIDIVASVLLIAFAGVVAFVVIPRENPGGVWHGLSPYFYPMVMLGGIALGSVGLLIQAIAKPETYEAGPFPITRSELGFFLLIFAIILASVLLMHRFGALVGGPLLIAATMLFMGERRPHMIAIVTVATVAVTHALVKYLLQVPLP